MRREDDQQLWDLLGKAPSPELSDFFARNVTRSIREQPNRFEWVKGWLRLGRLVPASGLAIVLVLALSLGVHHSGTPRLPAGDNEPEVVTKIDPQDYEVVADLDELVAADENSLWEDDQTL